MIKKEKEQKTLSFWKQAKCIAQGYLIMCLLTTLHLTNWRRCICCPISYSISWKHFVLLCFFCLPFFITCLPLNRGTHCQKNSDLRHRWLFLKQGQRPTSSSLLLINILLNCIYVSVFYVYILWAFFFCCLLLLILLLLYTVCIYLCTPCCCLYHICFVCFFLLCAVKTFLLHFCNIVWGLDNW